MHRMSAAGLGAVLALVVNAAPVEALTSTVYVSATGSDSNACTFVAPCRLFTRAIAAVSVGGVIQVLNPGGYGNALITKSLTISGGGNLVASGNLIRINSASAVVVLRGLLMDGRNVGAIGILISAAAAVHIEDCAIERYTGRGIQVSSATEVFIAGTVSRDNGIDGLGIFSAGQVAIDNSRFENNHNSGVYSTAGQTTVTHSIASGNTDGYFLDSPAQMTLEASAAQGNTNTGINIALGATIRLSNSVLTNNDVGYFNSGTFLTRENNTISGNPSNVGPRTPIAGL